MRGRTKNTPEYVVDRYLPDRPADGCWIWQGRIQENRGGYGVVKIDYRDCRAHRVAYEYFKGPIPEGMFVRHTCDNPPCCNPAHLLVGTPRQNSGDAVERNRIDYGVRRWNAKLNDESVREIRRLADEGWTPTQLARHYGMSTRPIYKVLLGITWKRVTEDAA